MQIVQMNHVWAKLVKSPNQSCSRSAGMQAVPIGHSREKDMGCRSPAVTEIDPLRGRCSRVSAKCNDASPALRHRRLTDAFGDSARGGIVDDRVYLDERGHWLQVIWPRLGGAGE